MRLFAASPSLAVLGLVLARTVAAQAFFTPDGPVQLVEAKEFDREVVKIEKPVLAMFFAHWCGHCRTTAPEFLKAARSLDGIVKFAAIDCDAVQNRDKCAEYDVKGYPTIKLFPATKRRVPRDYNGERKAQAFLDYAVDQLPLGAKKLQATELKPFLDKDPKRPKVILFSTKATSSPMFRSLALDFRTSHSFAYLRATDDAMHGPVFAAARAHLGLSELRAEKDLPVLVLVKPSSSYSADSVVKYEGKIKYRQVKAWLDGNVDPSQRQNTTTSSEKPKVKKAAAAVKKAAAKKAEEAAEEVIPEGGTIEWRAKNLDKEQESARAKLRENVKAASAKLAAASSSAASVASDATEAAASATASAPPVVKKVAEKVQETVEKVGDTLVDAANKVADAASAAADSATGTKVGEAIVNAGEVLEETLSKGGEKVAELFGAGKDKVGEVVKETKEQKVEEAAKETKKEKEESSAAHDEL